MPAMNAVNAQIATTSRTSWYKYTGDASLFLKSECGVIAVAAFEKGVRKRVHTILVALPVHSSRSFRECVAVSWGMLHGVITGCG